ncbi:MAG: leucyl/phenylalanyl-tRNA--protein transferase [Acidimicrobiia bacterium]
MPVEPPPSRWDLPPAESAGDDDVVGAGADLEPGTLLDAYRHGIFPMPLQPGVLGWWSPARRGILHPGRLHVSASLRRSCAAYEIRVDTAFGAVVSACADPGRPGGWIDTSIQAAYLRLHELGWAHSVEAWTRVGDGGAGTLAGGLYGVAIGGLFAGESMFHRRRDASKVALCGLVELVDDGVPGRVIDCQWQTPHLASLGCVEVARSEYLGILATALDLPLPPVFTDHAAP